MLMLVLLASLEAAVLRWIFGLGRNVRSETKGVTPGTVGCLLIMIDAGGLLLIAHWEHTDLMLGYSATIGNRGVMFVRINNTWIAQVRFQIFDNNDVTVIC